MAEGGYELSMQVRPAQQGNSMSGLVEQPWPSTRHRGSSMSRRLKGRRSEAAEVPLSAGGGSAEPAGHAEQGMLHHLLLDEAEPAST